ncbi:MAG TPA: glycosyltransferase family 1 protein [Patescibacteria group bacterium]
MLIGIDASRALRKKRTGTELYCAEIIKYLTTIDHINRYRLYSSKKPTGDMAQVKGSNIDWRVMPFTLGWTLIRLSLEILFHAPDVLFMTAHSIPLLPGKKSVVIMHDIGFNHFPEIYKWIVKLYHRSTAIWIKHFATHIIVPTEFTKQDIHNQYGISLNRITVVPLGFEPKEYRPASKGETPPLDTPYFYYIGRIEMRKNISRLLEAFAEFKRQTGLPHKLVLAGGPAYGYASIQATYENLGEYKKDVIMLGYTPQSKALEYMRHAEALVFPSLFEGFGLPVLEAFASDTPVITSNTTSLPEVAGDAAILVTPTKTNEIADAMIKIAQDKEFRNELIQKGREQYKQFSWERTARETLAVLEKVGNA